jgi:hypothetical protein
MMKKLPHLRPFIKINPFKHCGKRLEVAASIFLFTVMLWPSASYAQVDVPDWLSPSWVYEKVMNFHIRNSERHEQAQAQAKAAAAAAAAAKNPNPNQPTPAKTTKTLAPVETAVPKLNEKNLSPEELRELRRQLKNQK